MTSGPRLDNPMVRVNEGAWPDLDAGCGRFGHWRPGSIVCERYCPDDREACREAGRERAIKVRTREVAEQ